MDPKVFTSSLRKHVCPKLSTTRGDSCKQIDALHCAIPGPLDGQTWTRCFCFMFVTEQCDTASREGLVDLSAPNYDGTPL